MPYDSKKMRMQNNEGEILELIKEILEITKDGRVTPQEKTGFLQRVREKFRRS